MELAGPADTIVRVTVRSETQYHFDNYRLHVGSSVLHCNRVHRCVVDAAFHLA